MSADDKKGIFRDIDADDDDPEITEIESFCMRCEGQVTEIKSIGEHSHNADHFAIEAMKVKYEIRNSMKETRGTTAQVVADKLAKYPKEVAVAAGTMQALKRFARRQKQGASEKEPTSMSDIPIPLPHAYTCNHLYDNESSDKRLLVYASDEGLRLLGDSTTWFMDGTHSTSPSQFQQIFCIRTALGSSYQSVVYALLPSKTQATYEECLTAVLDTCLQKDIRPNIETVVADYELAIHNALKTSISSNIHIQGCFYHFTQSTWRRVQSEGLQPLYREDAKIRHFCGMLDGLAFLPVTDVKQGMEYLRKIAPDNLMGLVDYFDATYVNGAFRSVLSSTGTVKFRRTEPLFKPETWNVHNATITGAARTNNVCEGWNNGFRNLVGHKNPSLWTVIDCLQKDATMVQADILRYSMGQTLVTRKKKTTECHQIILQNLCLRYTRKEISLELFLEAVGDNIRIQK